MFKQKSTLIVIGGFLSAMIMGVAYAQQSVVVVPLAGDDAAPGIADFDGGNSSFNLSDVDTIYRSVSINAPVAGKVIANMSGYMITSVDQVLLSAQCSISTSSANDFDALISIRRSNAVGSDSEAIAGTRGFDVPAGNFTVNLVCREVIGQVILRDSNLTAMYFPN